MKDQPLDNPFQEGHRVEWAFQPAFDVTERYCLRCNERLYEEKAALCPACGFQYDGGVRETYRSKPMFLRWKFWFPGVTLAIVCGVLSYAICLKGGELGWALFGAVPLSVGAILGYATRVHQWGKWMTLVMISLVAIATVVGIFTVGAAGVFCGAMLAVFFLVPVAAGFFVGVFFGFLMRTFLLRSSWDQRWFLPLVAFIAFPYLCQWVEDRVRPRLEPAVVKTKIDIHATPEEAWNAIMFYEDVEHAPPWLLYLALPRPVGSHGSKENVGDIVRCEYEQGYVVKRISRREEGRLLAFDVIEQHLGAERNVILLDGSFEVVPREGGETEIVLTTRYQRRLAPGWMWEPTERKVFHTLHEHVLEGMRRKVLNDRGEAIGPLEEQYRPQKVLPAPTALRDGQPPGNVARAAGF